MRIVGELKTNKAYKLVELEHGVDSVVVSSDKYGGMLELIHEGKSVTTTDKVSYFTLGGVIFLGFSEDAYLFVSDPRWVAAAILAQESEEGDVAEVELSPLDDIGEAVSIVQRHVRGYRWMESCSAWGVPGYEFGPQEWITLRDPRNR